MPSSFKYHLLTQHIRDIELMIKIKEYLGFGIITTASAVVILTVTKRSDIETFIYFKK